MIQVFSGKSKTEISSGISLEEKYWDDIKKEVKRKHPRNHALNAILRHRISQLQDSIDHLIKEKHSFTAKDILDHYKNQIDSLNHNKRVIVDFLNLFVSNNPENLKPSTLKAYNVFINCFGVFKRNVTFDELDISLINKYEKYLTGQGLAVNTISNRMKILRKAVTLAIDEGLLKTNPLQNYRRKREPGKREFLTIDELRLLEMHKAKTSSKQKVLDIFIFCVYTGLRIGDALTLKHENFTSKGGALFFEIKTKKTNTNITNQLPYKAVEIVKKYKLSSCDYVFNMINSKLDLNDPTTLYQEISRKTAYINKVLREISNAVAISKKVTSHVARHTFATLSISLEIPIETVSSMLGHSSITQTQIYVKILDESKSRAIHKWNNLK